MVEQRPTSNRDYPKQEQHLTAYKPFGVSKPTKLILYSQLMQFYNVPILLTFVWIKVLVNDTQFYLQWAFNMIWLYVAVCQSVFLLCLSCCVEFFSVIVEF